MKKAAFPVLIMLAVLSGTPSYGLSFDEVLSTIEENFKLAEAMGLNGTPSYVIGTDVVVGAVGLDGLREKVNIARCGKATC